MSYGGGGKFFTYSCFLSCVCDETVCNLFLTSFPSHVPGFDDNAGGYSSQQTPSKARRDYDAQTLIPVTIKMINESMPNPGTEGNAGDMVLNDERPIHMIKFVGAVRHAETNSTNSFLDIEDGTGLLSVKVYNGGREDGSDGDPSAIQEMKQLAFQEAQYVRIIGQVREFDGTKQVIANDVRVLSSGDELTCHFCEVAFSYEKHLKKKSQQGQMFGGGMMGYGIGNMASSGGPPPQAGGMTINSSGGNLGGGSNINDAIIRVIQNEGGEF